MAEEAVRVLRHGTTLWRAERILRDGPNPDFIEPGSPEPARGFSTAPTEGPFPFGAPEDYARAKARLYPKEGGPAILEIIVPETLLAHALDAGGEVRFEPQGGGLEELLTAWPVLSKRIIVP